MYWSGSATFNQIGLLARMDTRRTGLTATNRLRSARAAAHSARAEAQLAAVVARQLKAIHALVKPVGADSNTSSMRGQGDDADATKTVQAKISTRAWY
jgi:hypothetical protein